MPENEKVPCVPEASWAEVKKEGALIRNLIHHLPPELQADAASWLIVEAVICGSCSRQEALGILEEAKLEMYQLSLEPSPDEEIEP